MSDDALEKKHDASGRRIDELRRKGQSLRSRDLSGALLVVIMCIVILFMARFAAQKFILFFYSLQINISEIMQYDSFPVDIVRKIATSAFLFILPILLLAFIIPLLSPFIFGRWNFSIEALHLKWENLSPNKYFQRVFSKRLFINIGRSFIKFLIISIFLGLFIYFNFSYILRLGIQQDGSSVQSFLVITRNYLIVGCLSISIVAGIDVIFSYFEYIENIKMTTQEVKEETKEAEGNIFVKRKMRSLQMSMVKQRISALIPKSTVIITNPTHYAVGIQYRPGKDKTPKMLFKVKGHLALQVRQMAISHSVPIYEAPLLARAIYHTTKMGAEVKPELYMSVAIVLAYINQLNQFQHGLGAQPYKTDDLRIPKEFIFNE